jgi:CBS domain-containing protein
MSRSIPIVHINDDLTEVLQTMLKADIKRVIVLDEREKPIGIITDGDLVARVSQTMRQGVLQVLAARILGTNVRQGQATARELMSENVLSAPPDTTVVDAISLMLQEGRKRIVVVDTQGYPIGVVDRQMLLAASVDG